MNKFKKILGVALIAIMIMMPVFGAVVSGPVSFEITTKVAGLYEIGVFKSEISSGSLTSTANALLNLSTTKIKQGASESIDPEISTDATTIDLFLVVRTNQRIQTTVTVTADLLLETVDSTNTMEYNLLFPTGNTTTAVAVNGDGQLVNTLTVPSSNGVRWKSFQFNAIVTSDQFEAASIGDYKATITFTTVGV